jgi:hypothetical protein
VCVLTASGNQWRSTIAMIFMPFPRFRSSDFQPATYHNEGCVDEAFFFVQCASIAKVVRQHPSARDAKPHRGTKSKSADAQFSSLGSSAAACAIARLC